MHFFKVLYWIVFFPFFSFENLDWGSWQAHTTIYLNILFDRTRNNYDKILRRQDSKKKLNFNSCNEINENFVSRNISCHFGVGVVVYTYIHLRGATLRKKNMKKIYIFIFIYLYLYWTIFLTSVSHWYYFTLI